MRLLELFAGAGGAAEGLRRCGLEGAHVEWDADACATLRAAGFDDVREGDVRALLASGALDDYAGADLLWASPPCQPFSAAGKKGGATDERDGWPWTLDAVDRLRPRWLVAENVAGMTHHSAGCGERCGRCYLDRLVVALRERFAVVRWAVLDAADYGVPQRRRRVILVAGPAAVPWPKRTHARDGGLFGEARWRSLGEALGLGGAALYPERGRGCAERHGERAPHPSEGPAPTIGAGSSGSRWQVGPALQHMEGAPRPAADAAPSVGTKGNMFLLDGQRAHRPGRPQRAVSADDPAPALRDGNGSGPVLLDRRLLDRPSPCVSAVGEEKGSGAGGNPEKLQRASDALFLATGRRRLTVAECATLQAFPPGWPFCGTKGAQYRQVGNAVPPPLAEAVVRAVLAADATLLEPA